MKRKKEKLSIHQKVSHHLKKHFHKHVHKVVHLAHHLHHTFSHGLELIVVLLIGGTSIMYANLTGLQENLYRNNPTEIAQALLSAMQNPQLSLKQGNIISLWKMDNEVENTFAKGYCTYGAARISPEFFPFLDPKTQQRTWGGNAVDRCKNASDTGYKIGSIPSQGALIVYHAGGRFGSYGHVGKVMHYDQKLNKIIVRDMARVSRGTMSDRWEDLSTANVKCYIYNSKVDPLEIKVPDTTNQNISIAKNIDIITGNVLIITGNTSQSSTTLQQKNSPSSTSNANTLPAHNASTSQPLASTTPSTTPSSENILPIESHISQQQIITKSVVLNFDKLTNDIAKHFITQNDITASITTQSPLKFGEESILNIEITKKTGEKYSGLLPFAFTIVTTNDIISSNLSTLQLINEGKISIKIVAQKTGTSTIIISIDGTKIGEVSFDVK